MLKIIILKINSSERRTYFLNIVEVERRESKDLCNQIEERAQYSLGVLGIRSILKPSNSLGSFGTLENGANSYLSGAL